MLECKRILVTGAGGFVGSHLCHNLSVRGYRVRALARQVPLDGPGSVEWRQSPELNDPDADWLPLVDDVDCVIHLAARVHVMNETASDPLAAFRACNVDGTARLAAAARRAGVKHFIYLSTIKVNGESTHGTPFRERDKPAPMDPYAQSKWEAEETLKDFSDYAMAVSIIRPPLIYGPGVKGNMRALIKAVNKGLPMPLARIHNRRQMLGIDNLVSCIGRILEVGPQGVNIFLVADKESVAVGDLIGEIARCQGRAPRLFDLPLSWLHALAWLAGSSERLRRLVDDVEIDITPTCNALNWEPSMTWRQGIAAMLADGHWSQF